MRSVIFTQYGGPEVLGVVESSTPEPGAGEIRIAVGAAAVNPADVFVRSGVFADELGDAFPLGLGWDVAGTVDAVGPDVLGVAVGTPVIGLLNPIGAASGAQASHVVLPAASVAPAPSSATVAEAASFPLNSLTADQALDLLDLPASATLIVTGAAGGVGDYAVTLAARRGLRVVAIARDTDEDAVREAGATDFIVRTGDIPGAVRAVLPDGADGVLDAANVGAAAIGAVRDGGAFVAVNRAAVPDAERGIRVEMVFVAPNGTRLAEFAQGADAGWLRLRVARTFPLDEAAEAYRTFEAGGLRGRVVLTV